METAMNEKYIDLMETSINEKNFHIEEWERTKAMLRGELESRNLKIPSFGGVMDVIGKINNLL